MGTLPQIFLRGSTTYSAEKGGARLSACKQTGAVVLAGPHIGGDSP